MVARGATDQVIRRYVLGGDEPASASGGSVRIEDIALCDARGEPAAQFGPGDRAELHLTVQGAEGLRDCLLGFFINRASDRLPICDYNLPLDSVIRGHAHGVGPRRLAVRFEVNLLRGTYVLGLHIYDYPRAQFLWRSDGLVTFAVDERCSYAGVAHLRPTLEVLEVV